MIRNKQIKKTTTTTRLRVIKSDVSQVFVLAVIFGPYLGNGTCKTHR